MITVRPYKFEWPADLPRYWFDESPFKTHFMNSLSISFPQGEKFFIDSVNYFKNKITDPGQLDEIKRFIAQENWHRWNHSNYNHWLELQGYPIDHLEKDNRANLEKAQTRLGPLGRLVNTMVIEYITAASGAWVLGNPEMTGRMHPHFAKFWTWHALEEIEHQHVVHDLVLSLTENKEIARRKVEVLSRITFLISTWDLFSFALTNTIKMLKQDGRLFCWCTLRDAIEFLFNHQYGLVPSMVIPWVKFMFSPLRQPKINP